MNFLDVSRNVVEGFPPSNDLCQRVSQCILFRDDTSTFAQKNLTVKSAPVSIIAHISTQIFKLRTQYTDPLPAFAEEGHNFFPPQTATPASGPSSSIMSQQFLSQILRVDENKEFLVSSLLRVQSNSNEPCCICLESIGKIVSASLPIGLES